MKLTIISPQNEKNKWYVFFDNIIKDGKIQKESEFIDDELDGIHITDCSSNYYLELSDYYEVTKCHFNYDYIINSCLTYIEFCIEKSIVELKKIL